MKIYKLTQEPTVLQEPSGVSYYVLECYGEIDGEFGEFSLQVNSASEVYKIQRHIMSPTLEPYEVEMG